MKKLINAKWLLLFVIMLSLTTVNADAQRYGQEMRLTGNTVNVRTGPGKQYSVMYVDGWKVQFDKGYPVYYAGKKRNGFTYVSFVLE